MTSVESNKQLADPRLQPITLQSTVKSSSYMYSVVKVRLGQGLKSEISQADGMSVG
jgi:hypothetical protein